jgi:dephospho-CoA kinase
MKKIASSGTLVIGVTGGMASGKSTVARMFTGRGVRHLDADKIVHRLMQQDKMTIVALAKAFPNIVEDGGINRAALAETITKKPEKLAELEHILHPRVRQVEELAITQARRARARAIILDIPLLFETDAQMLCNVVIVAHAPISHRRRRAFMRPGMTEAKWEKLLARQLSDHIRNRAADIVIPTGIGKAATRRKVERLMKIWGLK